MSNDEEIIDSLDDIDLDIETKVVPEVTDIAPLEDDDIPSLETVVDEVIEDLIEKSTPKSIDIDDDIPDLSSPISSPNVEVQEEPKKTRGRKKKESTTTITTTIEEAVESKPEDSIQVGGFYESKNNIRFDPMFDVSKIKTDKYQTRKTHRTDEQVQELADKIKDQGQLEPIQIVVEGDEYQLVAGFGRLSAIKLLNQPTVKALVLSDLSQDEILTISFGTNEGRLELSDLDKIYSIGEFIKNHKNMDKAEVAKIFGYKISHIYGYSKMYSFFSKTQEWFKHFSTRNYPLYVYQKLEEKSADIKDVNSCIKLLENSTWETAYEFQSVLDREYTVEGMTKKVGDKINELSKEATDVEIEMEAEQTEHIATPKNPEEKTDKELLKTKLSDIEKHLLKTHMICKEISKINNFKVFVDIEDIKELNGLIKGLSSQLVTFV
jgi:ParB/RepB/Spo0J family partition protein